MEADFSVEMGLDDSVLEVPWSAPGGSLRYYNLLDQPELIEEVTEARRFSELAEFLRHLNAAGGAFATAWANDHAPWLADLLHAQRQPLLPDAPR